MPYTIFDRVTKWNMSADALADYLSLFSQVEYLSDKRFSEYHPTFGPPHKEFLVRLRDWLDHAIAETDQQLLLRLIPHIFFVGSREFMALYRAALNGAITRWLIEQEGLQFMAATFHDDLRDAIRSTWFCGITDSMQIAAFHHVNNIEGSDVRPDWRTLATFADSSKISTFMRTNNMKRLVLLEDFVGTGSQMSTAVHFAASLPGSPPVLVLPLIVGPMGLNIGQAFARKYSNVGFATTLALRNEAFICETRDPNEGDLYPLIRDLIIRLHLIVSGGISPDDSIKPYGPFGYNRGTPRRGALLVMYTNCPDNTLPIIHNSSVSWSALFPRSVRV